MRDAMKQTAEEKKHRWKDELQEAFCHWRNYALTLLKWVLFSILVGASVGAVGAVFHMAIDRATYLRDPMIGSCICYR